MPLNQRVLVTGANGFVGAWLVKHFMEERKYAFLDVVKAGRGDECDVSLDMSDASSIDDAVRHVMPAAIVHLAAIATPSDAHRNPEEAWAVNFTGTRKLAQCVLRHVPQCKFVYAGSSEVYGQSFLSPPQVRVDEKHPLIPISTYGATKAAADLALGQLAFEGLRSVRFRPFNHTGAGQVETFVVPAFASQIAKIEAGLCKPVISVGNLEAYRDFLDVRDIVRAYAAAAVSGDTVTDGQVFNLSTGEPTKIRSILDFFISRSGVSVEVEEDPRRMRAADIPFASGNFTAARQFLDWEPSIAFDETLATVLDYWREIVSNKT